MIDNLRTLGLTVEELTFDPKGRHHHGAGLHIRQMSLPAGKTSITLKHKIDHMAVLAAGHCVMRDGIVGIEREFIGPTCVPVPAGTHYAITAKTDVEWFCISEEDTDEGE